MSEDFYIYSTHVVVKASVAIFSRVSADFPDLVSISLITISNAFVQSPQSRVKGLTLHELCPRRHFECV